MKRRNVAEDVITLRRKPGVGRSALARLTGYPMLMGGPQNEVKLGFCAEGSLRLGGIRPPPGPALVPPGAALAVSDGRPLVFGAMDYCVESIDNSFLVVRRWTYPKSGAGRQQRSGTHSRARRVSEPCTGRLIRYRIDDQHMGLTISGQLTIRSAGTRGSGHNGGAPGSKAGTASHRVRRLLGRNGEEGRAKTYRTKAVG